MLCTPARQCHRSTGSKGGCQCYYIAPKIERKGCWRATSSFPGCFTCLCYCTTMMENTTPLPSGGPHKTQVVVVLTDSIVALDSSQDKFITDYIDPLLRRLTGSESNHLRKVSWCALIFRLILTYRRPSVSSWHSSPTVSFTAMALPSRSPNSLLLTRNVN